MQVGVKKKSNKGFNGLQLIKCILIIVECQLVQRTESMILYRTGSNSNQMHALPIVIGGVVEDAMPLVDVVGATVDCDTIDG